MQKDDIDEILGDGKSENEYESMEISDNRGSAEGQANENWDATLKIEYEKEETIKVGKENHDEQ